MPRRSKRKNLYIISGCNGAGKTTASETILPELLHCNEFVNADNIARGLSPFNVEAVAFEAGRIMLLRIEELLQSGIDFAFETTLSTKSYIHLVKKAQAMGYTVTLLFVWLDDVKLAYERVADRVSKGGHHIPKEIIRRRYKRGLVNLFTHFFLLVVSWLLVNNSQDGLERIANGEKNFAVNIENEYLWARIKSVFNGYSQQRT